jgi:hypothetical protein
MVLKVHGEPEKEMNWSTVGEFLDKKTKARVPPPCTYFEQESKPFAINWVLCYLWAGLRTDWFTARCYYDNNDVSNLGGNYQTIRESVRVTCTEFNKFVSTDMINEQDELEKYYEACKAFAKGENPSGSDPIVTPPKPTPMPKPTEPELPKEPLPIPDKTPVKWGKWLSILAPIVLLASNFLPPPFNGIARLVVEVLKKLFE